MTYVQASGKTIRVDVPVGDTVMDGALDHNIPGILGQCGGGCTCSTCHCYIEAPWRERLPPAGPDERELLAYAVDPGPGSRLACQVRLTESLDGLVVHLPDRQLP